MNGTIEIPKIEMCRLVKTKRIGILFTHNIPNRYLQRIINSSVF